MKLRLVVVGRDKNDPLCRIADEYLGRLNHYLPTELVEVKEEPRTKNVAVDRVKAAEAERLKKAVGSDYLITLDERGRQYTSVELAERLDRFNRDAIQSVAVVIGGPSGLDPALVKGARESWSLSKLTLPHRLVRVLIAEQLYRACTILRGEPYHK